MLSTISAYFYTPILWLPAGVEWEDMVNPHFGHNQDFLTLLWLLPLFIAVRLLLETTVFPKFALAVGVKPESKKILHLLPKSAELKLAFQAHGSSPARFKRATKRISEDLGIPNKDIEFWLRQHRLETSAPLTRKFSESMFRSIHYLCVSLFAAYILYRDGLFECIRDDFTGYPFVEYTDGIKLYYKISLAYYLSCIITVPLDHRRSDFLAQMIHHVATIWLIYFSYIANYIGAGALILLAHDVSDILLDTGKLFKYVDDNSRAADFIFIGFTFVFIVTRLVFFPYLIFLVITVVPSSHFNVSVPYYFANIFTKKFFSPVLFSFTFFFSVLLLLHIYWFSIIFKMAISFAKSGGKVSQDVRSDDEHHPDPNPSPTEK